MKYVLINCNLIDGTKGCQVQKNMNIIVENDRIVQVTNSNIDENIEKIDCTGKYVMPGLINMHVHLFGTGKPSAILGGGALQKAVIAFTKTTLGSKVVDKLVRKSVIDELYSGVTTLRAVGDFGYSDVRIRDEINSNKLVGPRLLVSGPAITVPGGHGDGTFAITGTTKEDLENCVLINKQNNVDLIKICVTGGVMDAKVKGEPGVLRMNLEQTKWVCDKAHELGYKVASHTESTEGLIVSLKGGVDTIEHGAKMDEEIIELFKNHKSSLINTLSPALPLAKLSPSLTKLDDICTFNANVVADNMIEGAKTALENNILVGLGTDASCPFATQTNTYRELYYYQQCLNVTASDAIHAATLVNAQIAGIDHTTGSIEEGKCADIIICEKNPLENILNLKQLDMVIVRGKRIDHPNVKRDPSIEESLDSLLQQI